MDGALGAILFALAVALTHWVRRRRFYRRNGAGLEVFANYGDAVGRRGLERLALLAAGLAGVCGLALVGLFAARLLWLAG
ncbi:hypothetical protein CFHF_19580 [Caulobacter flavus]|uniref:Molybdenum ABC transporter permease n=1 Tax=Caulobacter flavus TaxID=1679497 RepID=A0A2N5CNY7_9CAUL|nr:hypothetical protein [Caulobacter flavus]AYV48624.1 hypothetical protein C1707_21490 [Caulobacter flavus]PLR08661.1 hypothetical protein CFHF_19580 [Caulobacter flavus]